MKVLYFIVVSKLHGRFIPDNEIIVWYRCFELKSFIDVFFPLFFPNWIIFMVKYGKQRYKYATFGVPFLK